MFGLAGLPVVPSLGLVWPGPVLPALPAPTTGRLRRPAAASPPLMLLPDQAGMLLLGQVGMLLLDQVGMLLLDQAGMLLLDQAGMSLDHLGMSLG